MTREPEKVLRTAAAQADAIGVSRWEIQAMRKAALGKPGSPFTGRTSTYSRLMRWRREHPEFVPSHIYPTRPKPASAASAAPKSGACKR